MAKKKNESITTVTIIRDPEPYEQIIRLRPGDVLNFDYHIKVHIEKEVKS